MSKPVVPAHHGSFKLSDLKLQIIHNMSLDISLSPSAHKIAIVLITALLDRDSGWCFRSDVELAQCAGISADTLRRSVKKSAAFLLYFRVTSGKRKGSATEYQLTDQAMRDGAKRRSGRLGNTTRSNGESAITNQLRNPESKVGKKTNLICEGGENSAIRGEEFPVIGGKKHPPILVPKPSSNTESGGNSVFEDVEPISVLLERFTQTYPRKGDARKIEAAFLPLMAENISPDAIIEAAKAYAHEQMGNDARYIMLPENWLCRTDFTKINTSKSDDVAEDRVQQKWADWIKDESDLARRCSPAVVRELLERGLVTREECSALDLL